MKKLFVTVLCSVIFAGGAFSAEKVTQAAPAVPGAAVKTAEAATIADELSAEIKLGTGIEKMNILGEAAAFPANGKDVFCWTRIKGAKTPTKVTHIWSFEGKESAKVELEVKSFSWRTWSSRTILPEWNGKWKVAIVDAAGKTIGSAEFTAEKPAPVEISAPAVVPEAKPKTK